MPPEPAPVVPRSAAGSSRRRRDNRAGYVFLVPWLCGFFLLVAGPVVASAYLSLTDFSLLTSPKFIGLANYLTAFTDDPRLLRSLLVTSIYVVVSVPVRLAVALAVAVVVDRLTVGAGAFKAALYVPSLLGGSVAVAVLWRQVFGADGMVNRLLMIIGVDHPPAWVSEPRYALGTIIILAAWQFGSPMIIFLAALRQIPAEINEAAAVDGATGSRRFFSITLPLLTPIIFFNTVMQVIVAFQAFTPAYVISNGSGGPVDSTLFYSLYLYQQGFGEFRMGYASAMAWIMLGIVALVTGLLFASSRFWVFYSDSQEAR